MRNWFMIICCLIAITTILGLSGLTIYFILWLIAQIGG